MGDALYDIKGLTFQGHLNQFWQTNFKPDMRLFNKYRAYLLNNTQINANYYSCVKVNALFLSNTESKCVNVSEKEISEW